MTLLRQGTSEQGRPGPTRARRWTWIPVLGLGVMLYIAVEQTLVITGNPTLVPSLLVLGTLVVPVSLVVYVDGRNPAYHLPLSVLLSCAFLGGVLGAAVASVLEFETIRRLGELSTVYVALIEEAAKLLVPITLLIVTWRRASLADGLLIGVAVGMGFAVLETLGYGFVTLLASAGDLTDVEGRLLLRAALSPAAHAAWTGLAAAALWWAHSQRWRLRGLAAAAGTFLAVVALHTLWDATHAWFGYLLIGLFSTAALLGLLHRTVLTTNRVPLTAQQPPEESSAGG